MEFYLSKQEYEIVQLAVIAWGAFLCWDKLVTLSHKFPNTATLFRNLMNRDRERPPPPPPPPQNNPQPAEPNIQRQNG